MSKSEKLNWTIAIVGLLASLISIFVFLTGIGSLPGLVKKPAPAAPTTVVSQPPKPASKHRTRIGLGTLTDPVKRALTLPHKGDSSDAPPSSAPAH